MTEDTQSLPRIIQPGVEQIPGLGALNQYWLAENHPGDKSRGFVGGEISADLFEWMINQQLLVATVAGDEVVGYFVSCNQPDLPILHQHKAAVEKLKQEGKWLQPGDRVAVGLQSAVAPAWQGKGLIDPMRHAFLHLVADRFDWVFTTIAEDNLRSLQSSLRFGWQIVGFENGRHYLLLKVPPIQS